MGSRIITIFEIMIGTVIVLLISSFIITNVQVSNSINITSEFADTVKYKGYITQQMYNNLLDSYGTGVQVTFCRQKYDDLNDDEVFDMTYTAEVIDALNTDGIYKLKKGDSFYVTVRRTSPYYHDIIISAITFRQPTLKPVIAVRGGLVLNEQY